MQWKCGENHHLAFGRWKRLPMAHGGGGSAANQYRNRMMEGTVTCCPVMHSRDSPARPTTGDTPVPTGMKPSAFL